MRIGHFIKLAFDRIDDVRMPVPQTGHRCAARCVDITAALLVEEPDSFSSHREFKNVIGIAVENVCHGPNPRKFNNRFTNLYPCNTQINQIPYPDCFFDRKYGKEATTTA